MLGIIVLLEGPVTPNLQFPDAQPSVSSQMTWHFLPGFPNTWLNPSCPPHAEVSSTRGSKAATEHHWATAMLHCRQGALFSVCFILPPPDVPLIHRPKKFLIHRPKKFQFCFITPQHRIPKPLWLIYIVLIKLEPLCLWVSSGDCTLKRAPCLQWSMVVAQWCSVAALLPLVLEISACEGQDGFNQVSGNPGRKCHAICEETEGSASGNWRLGLPTGQWSQAYLKVN